MVGYFERATPLGPKISLRPFAGEKEKWNGGVMSLCGDNDEDSLMAWKVPSFFIEVKTEDEEGMATQIQFGIEREA